MRNDSTSRALLVAALMLCVPVPGAQGQEIITLNQFEAGTFGPNEVPGVILPETLVADIDMTYVFNVPPRGLATTLTLKIVKMGDAYVGIPGCGDGSSPTVTGGQWTCPNAVCDEMYLTADGPSCGYCDDGEVKCEDAVIILDGNVIVVANFCPVEVPALDP